MPSSSRNMRKVRVVKERPCPIPPKVYPRVIIVGGGLGGLMLGILLEKMGVPYHIFERAPKIKPLGALMCLNGNILAVFEQLNLLEEVMKISLVNLNSSLYSEKKMEKVTEIDVKNHFDYTGYKFLMFSRPDLYAILYKRIPRDKISLGKRVLSTRRLSSGIQIVCSDNSCYEGDILVGADGAYSAIRQNMFREMRELQEQQIQYQRQVELQLQQRAKLHLQHQKQPVQHQRGRSSSASYQQPQYMIPRRSRSGSASIVIPYSDTKEVAMPYMCMVGTTQPLDPKQYPVLTHPNTQLHHVIGESTPYSWTVITIPGNRFCWSVMVQITNQAKAREMRSRDSEWGPEANEDLIQTVRRFPVTFGGTLGDIIAATPKERISKMMLEEKMFETWYHGSIVLIGDACHKMLPTSGQGAMNAMQDAVILANCIYDLEDLRPESLTAAFRDYKEQRYKHAKKQTINSRINAMISSGQTRTERLFRHVVLNLLPRSIQNRHFNKDLAYRPQCTFLERIPDKGSVPSLPQKPSRRFQSGMQARATATSALRDSKFDDRCWESSLITGASMSRLL